MVTTVLVWLLVSGAYGETPVTIERFATAQECQRVEALLPRGEYKYNKCIQAHIAVIK